MYETRPDLPEYITMTPSQDYNIKKRPQSYNSLRVMRKQPGGGKTNK